MVERKGGCAVVGLWGRDVGNSQWNAGVERAMKTDWITSNACQTFSQASVHILIPRKHILNRQALENCR